MGQQLPNQLFKIKLLLLITIASTSCVSTGFSNYHLKNSSSKACYFLITFVNFDIEHIFGGHFRQGILFHSAITCIEGMFTLNNAMHLKSCYMCKITPGWEFVAWHILQQFTFILYLRGYQPISENYHHKCVLAYNLPAKKNCPLACLVGRNCTCYHEKTLVQDHEEDRSCHTAQFGHGKDMTAEDHRFFLGTASFFPGSYLGNLWNNEII